MRTTLGLLVCLLYSATASAHAYIKVPGNRTNDTTGGGQTAPCGGFAGGTKPATAAYTYMPGQSVQITINDPVPHAGHYELWWSTDNDTTFTVLPGEDNIASPATVMDTNVMVTMPAAPCTNCTLQLRMFVSANNSYYYSCADIQLAVAGADLAGTDPADMAMAATTDDLAVSDPADMAAVDPSDMDKKDPAHSAGLAGCGVGGSGGGEVAIGIFLLVALSLLPTLRRQRDSV